MKKKYRLIEDFKKHDQTTIWKHLDAMAVNYAVYSTQRDLSPFLTDYAVYLYCTDSCMVVVCLDRCGHCKEQEYAESRTLGPLIYNHGQEPRVSIVWKLAQAVKAIRNRLQIPVYGVLITEAVITNADELYSMWDSNNVMVIDDMKNMKFHYIWVNHDDDLDCKSFVDNLLSTPLQISDAECDTCSTPPTTETPPAEVNLFDEEFERLLKEFINGASTDTDEKAIDDSASSSDCKSVESPSDTADESPAEEEEETPPFPDGEIEQNPNLTVKVEVLRPMPNPREELEKLVGCTEIKQRMDELVNLTAYNQILQRSCPAAKQHAVSLHSLFLGRPGTGKTTVCKIFGSLLRQAGALSKGHVVVCDRGSFIGTLWGDEERAMRQLINLAKGGVLMIDEAYLLNSANENDPGKIVLQLLMNTLADESQRDIAIVLCGYKEPMTQLLELNPGFQSRFPNRFEFPDFTIEELLEITKHRVHDYRYRFTKKAWEKYVAVLSDAFQVRDPLTWGNARFVGNLLERIYLQHATRCVKQQVTGKSALLSLIPEDIVPIEVPRQRKKIGF